MKATEFAGYLPEAAEYLAGRGITLEMAERYRLGVARGPFSEPVIEGRLSIPYINLMGVSAIKYRDMTGNADAKYLAELGSSPTIYNITALMSSEQTLFVTEGELDALVVDYIVDSAVGIPGSNVWDPWFPRAIGDCEDICIVADGDDSGRKAAKRIKQELPQARIVVMPDGHDANSYYVRHGADALRGLLL